MTIARVIVMIYIVFGIGFAVKAYVLNRTENDDDVFPALLVAWLAGVIWPVFFGVLLLRDRT